MKILITTILALCLTINISFAQTFPNINLSQVPSTAACLTNSNEDQFAKQQGDDCQTSPWFASHGTPDVLSDRFTRVGSGKNSSPISEGVAYRQTFFKGKLYIMDISFSTNTDKFNVFLANGVPISLSGTNTPSEPNRRSFSVPNVSDKQSVIVRGNTNLNMVTETISFIPNKDYECLWIFSEDNNSFPIGEINEALFKVNSLTCDIEPTKKITSTHSKFDYGARGDGNPFHIPMQSITATNRINIIPQNFVSIIPYLFTIPYATRDPKVNLVAGKSILIKPDNNVKSVFTATRGSIFSAKISNNTGCEDACEGYLPWNEGCCGLKLPVAVNKCDNEPAFTECRLVSNYPKAYNAYRVEMIVFPTGGGVARPIFAQVWEDPQKRSLPEACVVWKPGSLDYGNYNVYIKLTNCYGDHIMTTSDGYTRPDVTVICGSPFPDDFGQLSNKVQDKSITIVISPNPTTGTIGIISNADIVKPTIKITNILGKEEASFYIDNIFKNNSYEQNISNLPTGIYIISILSDNKVISRTKISKL
jgi:Secretion system C-terminal sorting domain